MYYDKYVGTCNVIVLMHKNESVDLSATTW